MQEAIYSPDQHIRNLRWILESDHDFLVQKAASEDKRFITNRELSDLRNTGAAVLAEIEKNPQELNDAVQTAHRQRMGIYSETLLTFFLQKHPQTALLSHNLPVRSGKRSVGEFDFIFRYHEEIVHLELSVKLYLEVVGASETQYIGTLRGDTLAKKVDRITRHQLELSKDSAANDALASIGVSSVSPRALLKGFLFSRSDPTCWLRTSAELLQESSEDTLYRLPYSFERLALWQGRFDQRIFTVEDLVATLNEEWVRENAPVIVLRVERDGEHLREISRGFVMPEGWYDESMVFVDNLDK